MSVESKKHRDGEVKFNEGQTDVFGYTSMIIGNEEIIAIKGKGKVELYKGMEVELEGDSRGYVPSGHKDGQKVRITGFREPFTGTVTDAIIEVTGGGITGRVKPSNIKNTRVENPDTIAKDGRIQLTHTFKID